MKKDTRLATKNESKHFTVDIDCMKDKNLDDQ